MAKFFSTKLRSSPDRNDILFTCGWNEVETESKKIQWRAGNSS